MRKFTKIKTILVIAFLGIVIMFSAFNSNTGIKDKINVQDVNFKISAVSGKIHIDNNWSAAKTALLCTGNGIYSDPYVIEDLVIDGGGSGSCILIENSNVFFKIENCTLHNSGDEDDDAGIELRSVNNGLLINNNASNNNRFGISLEYTINNTISGNTVTNNNYRGIRLSDSYYNTISGNTADNNDYGISLFFCDSNIISGNTASHNTGRGIYILVSDENDIWGNIASYNYLEGLILSSSSYNTVSGNTANNNNRDGIYLYKSSYNTISGNTANNNNDDGIILYSSSYNTISGNTLIGNDECIVEDEDSQGNKFSDNGACTYGQADGGIPGYNIYFLIGILPILVIIMSKKLKKS